MSSLRTAVTLFFILLLALLLRGYNYWVIPLTDETADEIAWTWLGSSLIQEQVPASWSYFTPYQNGYIYQERVNEAPIVQPALDHPPLFSFVPGIMHTLANPGEWSTIPSRKVIRLPMVILGVINVGLLYFVARKVFSTEWSLVTAAIYASAPVFVLASRLVVAENALITLSLLLFLAVMNWLQEPGQRSRMSWAIGIICVAAVLTKISGVVLPISVLIFGLMVRKTELAKLGLIGGVGGVLAMFSYAGMYNLPLFLDIQFSQAGRVLGLSTLYNRFFVHPTVAKLVLFDGWILTSLFAFFLKLTELDFSKSDRDYAWKFLLLFMMLSIIFILVTSGEYTYHGWYSYTLFPLFALTSAYVLKKAFDGNAFLGGFVWLLLLVTVENAISYLGWSDKINNSGVRLLYLLGFIPVVAQVANKRKLQRWLNVGLVVLLLVIHVAAILSINEFSLRTNHNQFFFYLQQ